MSGKNAFGPGAGIVLMAADDKKSSLETKETKETKESKDNPKRKADLIKLHLECVQPLEAAKDKLADCLSEMQDPGVASQVRGFLEAVSKIQEQMLQLTISAIRTKDNERLSVPASLVSKITPGMISGEESIPSEMK